MSTCSRKGPVVPRTQTRRCGVGLSADADRLLEEVRFGDLVKFARIADRHRQWELAFLVGWSREMVEQLEKSRRPPNIRSLARVALAASCDLIVTFKHIDGDEASVTFPGAKYERDRRSRVEMRRTLHEARRVNDR